MEILIYFLLSTAGSLAAMLLAHVLRRMGRKKDSPSEDES